MSYEHLDRLRMDACSEHPGMHLDRLNAFLGFIASKLRPDDFSEAAWLLHVAISPIHAARRHREKAADAANAAAERPEGEP